MNKGLRIIGGKWRGRTLKIPTVTVIRPTPDRLRETLFGWLAFYLPDSICLDLFAGSGALSFEALSRGAAKVYMVEKDLQAQHALQENIAFFETMNQAALVAHDVYHWLKHTPVIASDIIFLDPPYHEAHYSRILQDLEEHGWLNANPLLYIESAEPQSHLMLPPGYVIFKTYHAGMAHGVLYQRGTLE